jgi:hypothetical protein
MENYIVKFEKYEDEPLIGSIIFYNEQNIQLSIFDFNIDDIKSKHTSNYNTHNAMTLLDKKNIFENFILELNNGINTRLEFIYTNGEISIKKINNIITFTLTSMCMGCSFSVIENTELINVFNLIKLELEND